MKRFRFSLEALATLRRAAFERALEQYGRSLLEQREAIARWEASRLELAGLMESRRALQSTVAGDWEQQHRWQEVLELRMESRRRDLVRVEEALRKDQSAVFAARRDVDALERIRVRRLSAHQQDSLKAEQKELDEIASRLSMACGLLMEKGHGKSLHRDSVNSAPGHAEGAPSE
ncbi:MAG: flagellar FliJ family protein [Verrucomicrobia bacterium]|nr:flagellar FliJ family protein [Verrucomicrobiota bacterium]MBI3870328.1 flagellar FliJ family protein [Verrucomicrobiota bacterium]